MPIEYVGEKPNEYRQNSRLDFNRIDRSDVAFIRLPSPQRPVGRFR